MCKLDVSESLRKKVSLPSGELMSDATLDTFTNYVRGIFELKFDKNCKKPVVIINCLNFFTFFPQNID